MEQFLVGQSSLPVPAVRCQGEADEGVFAARGRDPLAVESAAVVDPSPISRTKKQRICLHPRRGGGGVAPRPQPMGAGAAAPAPDADTAAGVCPLAVFGRAAEPWCMAGVLCPGGAWGWDTLDTC